MPGKRASEATSELSRAPKHLRAAMNAAARSRNMYASEWLESVIEDAARQDLEAIVEQAEGEESTRARRQVQGLKALLRQLSADDEADNAEPSPDP